MMYKTQTLWLEETEESIANITQAEQLGFTVPNAVFMLYTKDVIIDLSLVTSIEVEEISIGEKKYRVPKIILMNGEIHTLNEDIHELNENILKAKKQEGFTQALVPRPIKQASEE